MGVDFIGTAGQDEYSKTYGTVSTGTTDYCGD